MAFKYVALFAVLASVASAISAPGYQHHHAAAPVVYHHAAAPVYHQQHAVPAPIHHHIEHHDSAPPHYDFAYAVHDEHTGDIKSQHESRKDDRVHGSYSLIDADGYKRTVEYTADDHNGFQATVHREPLHHHVAAPVVHHHAPAAPAHHNYHY